MAIFFPSLAKHESLLDPGNPPGLGFASLLKERAIDPLLTPEKPDKLVSIFGEKCCFLFFSGFLEKFGSEKGKILKLSSRLC